MTNTSRATDSYVASALRVLQVEAAALLDLSETLDECFDSAVKAILDCRGRVIVCGMGKSGIIGRKICATLASTGTPAIFLHPGEAFHGDLGMVGVDDLILAISYSGETEEVIRLLPFFRENGNTVVAMCGSNSSTLARLADSNLSIAVSKEACPLNLAPTSSTTVTLALGDALAIAVMEARGFRRENFAKFHPGGSLGRRLLNRVRDEMLRERVPVVDEGLAFLEVVGAITDSAVGLAVVERPGGEFGVVTDGDIRRALKTFGNSVFSLRAKNLATFDPVSTLEDTRYEDALSLMARENVSCLLVVDEQGHVVGVLKR